MEKLEKVETIREKCGVSYEDAKAALDACDDDVLDAIIWLEKNGKAKPQTANYTTSAESADAVSPEMAAAQSAYQESTKQSEFSEHMNSFWEGLKDILHKSIETKFVAMRKGEEFVSLPVLVLVLGVFLWGATIWLLIIGLFFGLRYHFEGVDKVSIDPNGLMDKAADAADTIKKDVTGND